MNEFGKFPHYIPFLLFINLIHLKLGGGVIYYHFTYSSSHLPLTNMSFPNYAIYIGMIHNMKKRISNVNWWFIISNACVLLNLMYCSKNTSKRMNVVHTRTNICYIHGFHTRTNHGKNRCHSCISNHGMIYYYIPSSCKAPTTKPKFLKRINA